MTATMKLKTLESYLQDLNGFTEPKIQYEQYETPAHIAAVALYNIQTQFDALENKLVLDAGCGPGVLSIGAALLGAGAVIAVDIDRDALSILHGNIEEFEIPNIDAIQCDLINTTVSRWDNYFDTVLMNPPFGTKNNAGIDMKFLKTGLDLCCENIFSLHKSSTRLGLFSRSHIKKKIKEWGVEGDVVAELKYNLSASYKFHKKESKDIAVDLWRIKHPS